MPASFRNLGTVAFGTTSVLVTTNPVHLAGDMLLLAVGSSANAGVTPTHVTPADWTLIGSAANSSGTVRARLSVYFRGATSSSMPNVTVSVGPTGSTASHHSAVVISVQDPEATWAYEGMSTGETPAASALALDLATTNVDRLCVEVVHHADNVATAVSNATYTQRLATDNATGIDGYLYIGTKAASAAGAHGSTVTFTGGGTAVGIAGVAFAILPLAGGPQSLDAPSATVAAEAGGVATSAIVPWPAAEATSSGGGVSFAPGLGVPAATATTSAGDVLISGAPGLIGPVTYPTATTWECLITGLTETTTFDIASSDGQATEITLDAPAVPHMVRAEAGGTPTYATLSPGADGEAGQVIGTAGSVATTSTVKALGATVTTGGVEARISAVVPFAAGTVTTSGGEAGIVGQGHVVRAEAGGVPALATLVPGADGIPAIVSTSAGAVAFSGVLTAPSASVTTSGGTVSARDAGVPAATATTSAGSVRISATVPAPAGVVSATGADVVLSIPVPWASATTSAGAAAIEAVLGIPAGTLTTGAGQVSIGQTTPAPYAGATATAGETSIAAAVPVPFGLATTEGGEVDSGAGSTVSPTAMRISLARSGHQVELDTRVETMLTRAGYVIRLHRRV